MEWKKKKQQKTVKKRVKQRGGRWDGRWFTDTLDKLGVGICLTAVGTTQTRDRLDTGNPSPDGTYDLIPTMDGPMVKHSNG